MIDLAQISEDMLGPYWLQVWKNLVEAHWNYIVHGTSSEQYDFAHMRKRQLKESVDSIVADLATDYWERNRFELKEHFINMTCDKWNAELAVERDVIYVGWIDFGADPCYPNRRHEDNKNDAPWLAYSGRFQAMLKKAERDASLCKQRLKQ